jgi:hypothetical protein
LKTSLLTPHPSLYNKKTNWIFCLLLSDHLDLNVPFKTTSDIEAAIKTFTNLIQWAGWISTPEPSKVRQTPSCPLFIKHYLRKDDCAESGSDSAHRTSSHLTKAARELKQRL